MAARPGCRFKARLTLAKKTDAAEPAPAAAELGPQELADAETPVPLATRLIPLLHMLRRSSEAGEPVVCSAERH